jgi:hypothetical protein
MLQYQGLEEKVAERTRELEISKKAAEAANESKTLFIANISHELKSKFPLHLSSTALSFANHRLCKCSSVKWHTRHVCCVHG